jgi:hypothetical protein
MLKYYIFICLIIGSFIYGSILVSRKEKSILSSQQPPPPFEASSEGEWSARTRQYWWSVAKNP